MTSWVPTNGWSLIGSAIWRGAVAGVAAGLLFGAFTVVGGQIVGKPADATLATVLFYSAIGFGAPLGASVGLVVGVALVPIRPHVGRLWPWASGVAFLAAAVPAWAWWAPRHDPLVDDWGGVGFMVGLPVAAAVLAAIASWNVWGAKAPAVVAVGKNRPERPAT